jgi:hypothetical protein
MLRLRRWLGWWGVLGIVWSLSAAAFLSLLAAAPGLTIQRASAETAAPSATSIVSGTVRVTNVNDAAFSISWLTDKEVTGTVRYGLSPTTMNYLATVNWGSEPAGRTHHVTVLPARAADTWHYYDILSGDSVDDNGGVHYIYCNGPVIGFGTLPPGDSLTWGLAVTGDGAPMAGSLVYMTVEDTEGHGSAGRSAPLSMVIQPGSAGYWHFDMPPLREADLRAQFVYSSSVDLMQVSVQGDPDGLGSGSFTPVQAATLGLTQVITLTPGTLPAPPAPAAVPGPGPDLVVQGITWWPAVPTAGYAASFTVTVKNNGTGPVTTPFRVSLYLDHSRLPYPGEESNTNTYWQVTQTLAAGQVVTLSAGSPVAASGTITRLLAAGTHTVYAQVDSYSNQVAETNEANNILGPVSVTVAPAKRIYLPVVVRNY